MNTRFRQARLRLDTYKNLRKASPSKHYSVSDIIDSLLSSQQNEVKKK